MKNEGYQHIEEQQQKGSYEQIKCKNQNKALYICQNRNCIKDPLICTDNDCECNLQHENCIIIVLSNFIKNIQSKAISLKPIQQTICGQIQKAIDQLSDFKDEMIIKLKQKFQYVGLTNQQITILQAFKKGNFEDESGDAAKINGEMIWNISFNFQKSDETNQKLKKLSEQIGEISKKLNKEIKTTTQSILSLFQDFKSSVTDSLRIQQLFKYSKVILNKQQKINLIGFFNFCKVEKAKLLYRAWQNQFDASKFHQMCDNIPHTLCIAQTQFGKILGGYTPLCWGAPKKGQYVKDQSGRSFLFSLTNNDKFQLVSREHAIYIRKDYGPIFGAGHNFIIHNKSNIGGPNGSRFVIYPSSYSNSKYPSGSKYVYEKLNGYPNFFFSSEFFKVKQWQVWSLQLKDN